MSIGGLELIYQESLREADERVRGVFTRTSEKQYPVTSNRKLVDAVAQSFD